MRKAEKARQVEQAAAVATAQAQVELSAVTEAARANTAEIAAAGERNDKRLEAAEVITDSILRDLGHDKKPAHDPNILLHQITHRLALDPDTPVVSAASTSYPADATQIVAEAMHERFEHGNY